MHRILFILLCAALPTLAQATSLRALLEQAWSRNPQAQTLQAKRGEAAAQIDAADSLTPAAPALRLSHRSDQLQNGIGQRESFAGLALPLWLPGQRDARQQQAQADSAALEAALQAQRLQLAGELREALWRVRRAQTLGALDMERAETARKLAEDVAKRVTAGELARTDLNLAQNEWRGAQTTLLQNRVELLQAQQHYSALTGSEQMPEDALETVQAAALADNHPLLEQSRLAIASAQAQLRVAQEIRTESPELEIGTFRERGDAAERYRNSIELSLRIPFATAARSRPPQAAAETALISAQSEYQQMRLLLQQRLNEAQQSLDAATQVLDLARQQRIAAQENLRLIQKAFDLGETDLFALLRARSAAFESEQHYQQQETALGLARARLNQAQGVLP